MLLDFASAVRWSTGLRLMGSLALLSACSDGPYLMTEEYVTREGHAEEYIGGGCLGFAKGDGMSTGSAGVAGQASTWPIYSMSYEGTGDSIHFTVSDGDGTVVVDRTYDEDFLSSGKHEEVNAEVTGGSLRFVHRGAQKCEDVRAPDVDAGT